MAWTAKLTAVDVFYGAVTITVEVTNDAVIVDPGPPEVYLSFSTTTGYNNAADITRAGIIAWIRSEIQRVKDLYDKAQTLQADIGTVITL